MHRNLSLSGLQKPGLGARLYQKALSEKAHTMDRGPWVQTYSGRQFYVADPRPDDVSIEDIAHALALLCRYGGHCRRFYCPTPEQRILTADLQWVPAGSLKVGDELVGFDEHAWEPGATGNNRRRFRHATVTHTQPIKTEVWRLVLVDGSEIVTSAEHPWLVATKRSGNQAWRSVKRLALDLQLGRKRHLHRFIEPWKTGYSREDGWLAGLYDGEGYLSFTNRTGIQMGLSQKPGVILDRAMTLLNARGFNASRLTQTGTGNTYTLQLKGGWREMAHLLGTLRPIRLLDKFVNGLRNGSLDKQFDATGDPLQIAAVEYRGEQWVSGLETSTHTYLCEGFAAHNSVAEHSINVAHLMPSGLALEGLLHDAAEAYLVDVPRPIKTLLHPAYGWLEAKIMTAINEAFGTTIVDPYWDETLKWADNTMLHTEMLVMMAPPPHPWETMPPPVTHDFAYFTPSEAEAEFLHLYRRLSAER